MTEHTHMDMTYMWNLKYDKNVKKYDTMNLFRKQTHRHRKQVYDCQRQKSMGEG